MKFFQFIRINYRLTKKDIKIKKPPNDDNLIIKPSLVKKKKFVFFQKIFFINIKFFNWFF